MMNDTQDHINANKTEADGMEILFHMMSEQRCTCSSYMHVYVLQFPNGVHDATHK
jgi:hypothetical protein